MAVQLTVGEIERLAKAGVTMTIGDAGGQVYPLSDPYTPAPTNKPETLEEAFWARWRRSKTASRVNGDYGYVIPFKVLATVHGDKVWVSIHPINSDYEPFQLQDVGAIYPSDALMASVALWEKNNS